MAATMVEDVFIARSPGPAQGIADEAFDGGDAGVEVLQRLLLAQPRLGDARLGVEHFEQRETALAVALRDASGASVAFGIAVSRSTASSRSEPWSES